jgi:hypothetical protein
MTPEKDYIQRMVNLLGFMRDGGVKEDSPDMWERVDRAIAEGEALTRDDAPASVHVPRPDSFTDFADLAE